MKTEQGIRDAVRLMFKLERELYFETLSIFKELMGIGQADRSLEAANQALAYCFKNRRTRREAGLAW